MTAAWVFDTRQKLQGHTPTPSPCLVGSETVMSNAGAGGSCGSNNMNGCVALRNYLCLVSSQKACMAHRLFVTESMHGSQNVVMSSQKACMAHRLFSISAMGHILDD
jgi:hypothetical protein